MGNAELSFTEVKKIFENAIRTGEKYLNDVQFHKDTSDQVASIKQTLKALEASLINKSEKDIDEFLSSSTFIQEQVTGLRKFTYHVQEAYRMGIERKVLEDNRRFMANAPAWSKKLL